jgi:antitoxin MazE
MARLEVGMNARFSKWGNSIALRIPNGVAKELKVSEGSAAALRIRNGTLVVTPMGHTPDYDIKKLVALITSENTHGETNSGTALGNEFG